ncbi:MAG: hypothetical protein B6U89_06490 [Desulfurococcales archaeon ex4484_58]|nr:MAG: hypothetical protein B6U89_06490 [Desulfurococcales archaeon ex4484_58]
MKKIFWIMALEAFFGGFYVTVTRSITPLYFIKLGYHIGDLLLLNGFAGLASLLIAFYLRKYTMYTGDIKKHLLFSHISERILWFSIPFLASNKLNAVMIYSLAVLSSIPTSFFLNTSFYTLFNEEEYKKLITYRGVLASTASVLGQLIVILTLAFITSIYKYIMLYALAFIIGIIASILLFLVKNIVIYETLTAREEEIEIKATNIYLLLIMLFSASNLLMIAWTPRLVNDLKAPDYLAASLGLVQIITSIFASMFWRNRSYGIYRSAIIGLGITPFIVYTTLNPYLHLGIAILYSFSLVGTNFYASIAYASIIKKLGAPRAGLLLTSSNAFSLMIAGYVGYLVATQPLLVFILSSILGFLGLAIGLIVLPELAVVPPEYTKIYSRILYSTSISSYSFILFTMTETISITLKLIGLTIGLLSLFIIYRMIYYIIVLTGR